MGKKLYDRLGSMLREGKDVSTMLSNGNVKDVLHTWVIIKYPDNTKSNIIFLTYATWKSSQAVKDILKVANPNVLEKSLNVESFIQYENNTERSHTAFTFAQEREYKESVFI